jgi:pimeloyl-ACP methyl ester carboxylesterase
MPILHQAPPRGTVVVFVHGTFSCCIPSLVAAGPFRSPTYRFEHDTFRPITDNADELVQAVNRLLQPAPLYLVAHSRGGLVARLAARRLSQDCPVRVLTYGTPHLGTPLANAGTRAWSALLAMGRSAAGAFAWDPASLAGKVLMRPRELPPGLAVMRTDSETLRSWAFLAEPFDLVSCGAAYDEAALPDGRSAYTFGQRVLHESFGGVPNDLVVPTASALGAGTAQQLDGSCDHFSYFSRREVQEALRGL